MRTEIIETRLNAIKWRIDDLFEAGTNFDDAKKRALKEYVFFGLEEKFEKEIRAAVNSLAHHHLSKRARVGYAQIVYQKLLDSTGFEDTWWRRFKWNWFAIYTE